MIPRLFCANRVAVSPLFAPDQIPGLQFQLNASLSVFQDANLTTVASANNDPVGGWQSIVPAATLLKATGSGSTRPLLKTGSNGINNKPAVQFDGTDDVLSVASLPGGSTKLTVAYYGITTADVFSMIATNDVGGGTNGSWQIVWHQNGSGDEATVSDTNTNLWIAATASLVAHSFIWTLDQAIGASPMRGYINGVQDGSNSMPGTMTTAFVTARMLIGDFDTTPTAPWTGKLRHLLIYQNALTPTQVKQLHDWMVAN